MSNLNHPFNHVIAIHDGTPNLNGVVYTKDSFSNLPKTLPIRAGFEPNSEQLGEIRGLSHDNKGVLTGIIDLKDVPKLRQLMVGHAFLGSVGNGDIEAIDGSQDKLVKNLTISHYAVHTELADPRIKPFMFDDKETEFLAKSPDEED